MRGDWKRVHDLRELIGRTVVACNRWGVIPAMEAYGVDRLSWLDGEEDAVWFALDDGSFVVLAHRQDCCESVSLVDVDSDGDNAFAVLQGMPLVMAEVVTESGDTEYGTQTWSFYKFATVKGFVTLRWYGESNGYYSEEVDCVRWTERPEDADEPEQVRSWIGRAASGWIGRGPS